MKIAILVQISTKFSAFSPGKICAIFYRNFLGRLNVAMVNKRNTETKTVENNNTFWILLMRGEKIVKLPPKKLNSNQIFHRY